MSDERLSDDALVAGLSGAARELADAESAAAAGPAPAAWHRLREARARATAPTSISRRPWLVPAAAAVVLAAGLGGWAARRPPALTYVVSGARFDANGYVSAADKPTALRFSDGTEVRLERGARVSVGAPGPHGARVRVESGRARFDVRHLPGADWAVEAGPYRVAVTGTVFDVDWNGARETAVVTMHAGSVAVTGPALGEPLRLTAGQRFAARVRTGQFDVRIDREPAPEAAAPAPTAAPAKEEVAAASEAPPAPEPAVVAPPPFSFAPVRIRRAAAPAAAAAPKPVPSLDLGAGKTWAHMVADGDASGVLDDARALGLEVVLDGADADALSALADAARFSGSPSISTRALEALRRRFPSSRRAASAAFFLGRLADDAGSTTRALNWYRWYRLESPAGPYAAEALGREMLAVERLSGPSAARNLALDYLGRFPDGTYLLQARAILGLP